MTTCKYLKRDSVLAQGLFATLKLLVVCECQSQLREHAVALKHLTVAQFLVVSMSHDDNIVYLNNRNMFLVCGIN